MKIKINTPVQPIKTLIVKNPIDGSITSVTAGSTSFVSSISNVILIRFPIEFELFYLQISPQQFIKTFKFITNKIEGQEITIFDIRD